MNLNRFGLYGKGLVALKLVITTTLSFLIFIFVTSAEAAAPASPATIGPLTNGQVTVDLESLNEQILNTISVYNNTKQISDKNQLLNDATELAEIRQQKMVYLIQHNPDAANKVALSEQLRKTLPDRVKDKVEQRINVKGKLTLLHSDDLKNRKKHEQYYLHTQESD